MEEAEHLCDHLGIFVDGSLQCIGNAKQVMFYGSFNCPFLEMDLKLVLLIWILDLAAVAKHRYSYAIPAATKPILYATYNSGSPKGHSRFISTNVL